MKPLHRRRLGEEMNTRICLKYGEESYEVRVVVSCGGLLEDFWPCKGFKLPMTVARQDALSIMSRHFIDLVFDLIFCNICSAM